MVPVSSAGDPDPHHPDCGGVLTDQAWAVYCAGEDHSHDGCGVSGPCTRSDGHRVVIVGVSADGMNAGLVGGSINSQQCDNSGCSRWSDVGVFVGADALGDGVFITTSQMRSERDGVTACEWNVIVGQGWTPLVFVPLFNDCTVTMPVIP